MTPRVETRPVKEPVTFGSVNNIAKLSDDTLATWAKLMRAAPDARLVVLATSRDIEQTHRMLANAGIDPTRLTILPRAPAQKYMDLFNQFDIGLDPFPYNGGVTTCDALWMGVPLITLAGKTYYSRQGVSLLTRVGLRDLVAATMDDYVRIGVELAGNRERLVDLRHKLRELMLASPMCDYEGYTEELQGLLRTVWREYCARETSEIG
jgi:predicted O-linked N-acetylglucosamine transferase (SPINDLY family)